MKHDLRVSNFIFLSGVFVGVVGVQKDRLLIRAKVCICVLWGLIFGDDDSGSFLFFLFHLSLFGGYEDARCLLFSI
jgi:hypothetical protein